MASRALHGVNLTGWLTLEPWVTPSLFADSGVLDEASLVASLGRDRYGELVKAHRESFITAADFIRIAARGLNAVRLVVPWYAFGEAGPNPGPFIGCMEHVDNAFEWAEEIDLKIVLSLAIVPGLQDTDLALTRNHDNLVRYREEVLVVLGALAQRYAMRTALAGIEVADGAIPQTRRFLSLQEGVPMHALRNYYRAAYDTIREYCPDTPVILPDAGQRGAWRRFMTSDHYNDVWLDSHLYHYMDDVDNPGSMGIRKLAEASRKSLRVAEKSGHPVMVGKWSGALPYSDSTMTPEGKVALERVFISEQLSVFEGCPAWFFQTWKTEGRLVGWDAGVSLSSFERQMLI